MNIGIVGLGLIGGSLALDLKAAGHMILGVSRQESTCKAAIARQIVDAASPQLSLLAEAELVFLCTPLGAIAQTVAQLVPHLQPNAILSDVGSVKQPIVEAIAPLWPNFVGGHPMAGTAESGLDAAQAKLFVDRPYVLTPTPETPAAAVEQLQTVVHALQSHLVICDPAAHDQAVAWISHLPVMVSASLISACLSESNEAIAKLAKQLASSGFRDTSRVGGGNPELGLMMGQYNRSALLHSLITYRDHIDQAVGYLQQEDWSRLEAWLQNTQLGRPEYLQRQG